MIQSIKKTYDKIKVALGLTNLFMLAWLMLSLLIFLIHALILLLEVVPKKYGIGGTCPYYYSSFGLDSSASNVQMLKTLSDSIVHIAYNNTDGKTSGVLAQYRSSLLNNYKFQVIRIIITVLIVAFLGAGFVFGFIELKVKDLLKRFFIIFLFLWATDSRTYDFYDFFLEPLVLKGYQNIANLINSNLLDIVGSPELADYAKRNPDNEFIVMDGAITMLFSQTIFNKIGAIIFLKTSGLSSTFGFIAMFASGLLYIVSAILAFRFIMFVIVITFYKLIIVIGLSMFPLFVLFFSFKALGDAFSSVSQFFGNYIKETIVKPSMKIIVETFAASLTTFIIMQFIFGALSFQVCISVIFTLYYVVGSKNFYYFQAIAPRTPEQFFGTAIAFSKESISSFASGKTDDIILSAIYFPNIVVAFFLTFLFKSVLDFIKGTLEDFNENIGNAFSSIGQFAKELGKNALRAVDKKISGEGNPTFESRIRSTLTGKNEDLANTLKSDGNKKSNPAQNSSNKNDELNDDDISEEEQIQDDNIKKKALTSKLTTRTESIEPKIEKASLIQDKKTINNKKTTQTLNQINISQVEAEDDVSNKAQYNLAKPNKSGIMKRPNQIETVQNNTTENIEEIEEILENQPQAQLKRIDNVASNNSTYEKKQDFIAEEVQKEVNKYITEEMDEENVTEIYKNISYGDAFVKKQDTIIDSQENPISTDEEKQKNQIISTKVETPNKDATLKNEIENNFKTELQKQNEIKDIAVSKKEVESLQAKIEKPEIKENENPTTVKIKYNTKVELEPAIKVETPNKDATLKNEIENNFKTELQKQNEIKDIAVSKKEVESLQAKIEKPEIKENENPTTVKIKYNTKVELEPAIKVETPNKDATLKNEIDTIVVNEMNTPIKNDLNKTLEEMNGKVVVDESKKSSIEKIEEIKEKIDERKQLVEKVNEIKTGQLNQSDNIEKKPLDNAINDQNTKDAKKKNFIEWNKKHVKENANKKFNPLKPKDNK